MVKYTKKELNALNEKTHIIYLIHNRKNGRNYVGQTVKTFNQRYCGKGVGAERVVGNTNEKLQNDLIKYGADSFKVTLLEVDVKNIEKLNELEKHYIKQYDGITKGYNTLVGGNNYDKNEFYELRRNIKSLYLQIKAIDNLIINSGDLLINGFYVEMVKIIIDEIGWDSDLHELVVKRAEHWKHCAMQDIQDKLHDIHSLGFNISLEDILEFYNLLEG